MKFLVDENLPVALSAWLTARGFEAEHTSAAGLNATPDRQIASLARSQGLVVVSKDRDYLTFGRNRDGPQVVRLRTGNMSTARLLELCGRVWPQVVAALRAGERVVEVRRDEAAP